MHPLARRFSGRRRSGWRRPEPHRRDAVPLPTVEHHHGADPGKPGQTATIDLSQEPRQPPLVKSEHPARRQPSTSTLTRQGLLRADVQNHHVQGASGLASGAGQPPTHPAPASAVVDQEWTTTAQRAAQAVHVPQPRPRSVERIRKPCRHPRLERRARDAGIDHSGGTGPCAQQRALPAPGKPADHDRRVERVREPHIPTGRSAQIKHSLRGYEQARARAANPVGSRPGDRPASDRFGAEGCTHR